MVAAVEDTPPTAATGMQLWQLSIKPHHATVLKCPYKASWALISTHTNSQSLEYNNLNKYKTKFKSRPGMPIQENYCWLAKSFYN